MGKSDSCHPETPGCLPRPGGQAGSFHGILESYLRAIQARLRPGTVAVYRSKLRQFIRYLQSQHPGLGVEELDRPVIEAWFRHLAEKVPPLLNGTRRHTIIAVRSFLDRIYGWGWVEVPLHSLIVKTDLPPEDRRLPRPLPQDVDEALRAKLQATGDLLSMALLFQRATGMRMGELCDLELEALEELDGNRWQIRVPLGKLHTERVVPLDQEGAELFRKIREARGARHPLPHPETGKPTRFLLLWPGNGKHHLREKLRRTLACACKAARLKDRVTSHRFRHTYATELLRNGISLPALAKILGHRSIEMTLQYAHLVQEDVWRQYDNARESMKSRYVIPASSPGRLPHQGDRADIHDLLMELIARLEGLRRDKQVKDGPKVIRVLERLRRVAGDLRNVVRQQPGQARPRTSGEEERTAGSQNAKPKGGARARPCKLRPRGPLGR